MFADRAFLRETFSEYVVVDTKVNEVFKLVATASFDFYHSIKTVIDRLS